jgi:DNA-binding NarL/FixJ family response regulator
MTTPRRPLTDREWQVFDLVTDPRGSRKAAAEALGISESTVNAHLVSVFRKLNVQTIGGAARKLGQAKRTRKAGRTASWKRTSGKTQVVSAG